METVPISDMYLASALLSYSSEVVSIDRTNPRRVVFNFKECPIKVWKMDCDVPTQVEVLSVRDVQLLFDSSKLMYMPNYHHSIRDIKSMLYRDDK